MQAFVWTKTKTGIRKFKLKPSRDNLQSRFLQCLPHTNCKWLDINELVTNLLKPHQELLQIKYFTSRVSNDPDKQIRQTKYIEALETKGVRIFYGYYQSSTVECKSCGNIWATHHEKMTDVNIATQMINHAYQDRFDMAMLISGDSDLVPPIKSIHENFISYQMTTKYQSHTIPSLSGTFGIPTRPTLNPKMPKEPSSPSLPNALTADSDKTKNGGKQIRKWLIMKEAQYLTWYIINWAESGIFKVLNVNENRQFLQFRTVLFSGERSRPCNNLGVIKWNE